MADENRATDFANALNQETERGQEPRGIPPLHPKEREKWVDLSQEEGAPPGMPDHNLFQLPKRKLRACYRRFDLSEEAHIEELEEIQALCLAGNGYVLAREEWVTTKEGDTFAIVKYLEPADAERRPVLAGKKRDGDYDDE